MLSNTLIPVICITALLSLASYAEAKDAGATSLPAAKAKVAVKKAETKKTKENTEDAEKSIDVVKSVWTAIKSGKYRLAVGGFITLLVILWRSSKKLWLHKLSNWWVGIITVAMGLLASIPEALAMEPFKWSTFIEVGLFTSGSAMVFWKVIAKRVVKRLTKKKESAAPAKGGS